MEQCVNCFGEISDMRKETKCDTCSSPLHKDCAISDGGTSCDLCYTVKGESASTLEFTLPEHIRRTHIETYRSCPYKFLKEVLEDNPMPDNEYTKTGQDVHELIEQAIEEDLSHDDAIAWIINAIKRYKESIFTYKTREEMEKRAIDSLDVFYETILPQIKNVFAVEETIFTNIGDDIPDVRITMDLITENNGELDMHDWKTGRVMVGKKLSTDLQAPLYIYSVQKKHNKPVRSFTFYYLQENKTRTFIRSEENPDVFICTVGKREYKISLLDAIREVKSLFSKIKKGHFNIPSDSRSMHFTCKMCHIKEQGLCRGADEEAWYQK